MSQTSKKLKKMKKIDKEALQKTKKQLKKQPVIVDVNLEDDKFIFSIGSGEKIKKAVLSAKDVHSYLRKSNQKIVANFLKIWGVIINPKKLKEKIKTFLPKIPIIQTVALHEENFVAEQVGSQFLISNQGKISLVNEFTFEDVEYIPMPKKRYPYKPYLIPKTLEKPSLKKLAEKILNEFKIFIDAPLEYKYAWTGDVIFTYVQDHNDVNTTHYDQIIGDVDSGKTRVLEIHEGLDNRPLFSPSLPVADIYNYLGTAGFGVILEDQAEDIHKYREKMKIYKSGYRKGAVVPRMRETKHGLIQKFYKTYGYKAFSTETKIKERGFVGRCDTFHMVQGVPVKDEIHTDDKKRWQRIKSELLLWRMYALNEPLPKLNLPFRGRTKELIAPTLRVVYPLPIIYQSIENRWKQKVEKKKKLLHASLEARVTEVIVTLFQKQPIRFPEIWEGLQLQLEIKENEEKKIVLKNGFEITKRRIARILRDILAGDRDVIHIKGSTTSTYSFEKERLERLGKKYGVNTELLTQKTLNSTPNNGKHS